MKMILVLALLLGACSAPPAEEMPSEELLQEKVEMLAQNLIEPNREDLEGLTHAKLTYGHSSGNIETKTQFVDALFGDADILSWNMSEMNKELVGNTAWVRHQLNGDMVAKGDTTLINLKVMMVWVYENNDWKLLARQAVK